MADVAMQNPAPVAGQIPDFPTVSTYGGQFIQYNIFGNMFEVTAKYRPPILPIGRGAYGIVCSVLNTETNEMMAMKKIANAFDNYMDAKRTLREIKLLRHFDHENIIGLRDVIPPPLRREFTDVYIATELIDTDLHQIIRSNQSLSEEPSQYFLYQKLRGLKYIHSAHAIHRDLKPSNLLINSNCDLKICDFGLARPTFENEHMTEYVVTRWYRAPELLLNSSDYTSAIDVWSVGCIYMELMNRKPLFPGRDHVPQMRLVTELLGSPLESDLNFSEGGCGEIFSPNAPTTSSAVARVFPHINPMAIDFIERMLTFDPTRRITVEESLAHPYLARLHDAEDEPICPETFSFEFERHTMGEEEMKEMIYQESIALNPELA
uniref:Mitogen-activated protein kinase 2 n=1 Tax=Rheum australe TaxID=284363 RepID=Q306S6_RHEAU|nr:mitogen-activated protein kinase 2 [Rheum australe]